MFERNSSKYSSRRNLLIKRNVEETFSLDLIQYSRQIEDFSILKLQNIRFCMVLMWLLFQWNQWWKTKIVLSCSFIISLESLELSLNLEGEWIHTWKKSYGLNLNEIDFYTWSRFILILYNVHLPGLLSDDCKCFGSSARTLICWWYLDVIFADVHSLDKVINLFARRMYVKVLGGSIRVPYMEWLLSNSAFSMFLYVNTILTHYSSTHEIAMSTELISLQSVLRCIE